MNRRALLLPAAALAVAAVLWQQFARSNGSPIPAATWRLGTGTDIRQAQNYEVVPAETPVRLSWMCGEPRFVYVFSHSAEDGTLLLFPSPELGSDLPQPIAAGNHVLPGRREGKELAWTTRAQILATTTYVVVAARERVPELETLLPRLRRWSTSVMPDRSMQVTNPTTAPSDGLTGLPRQGWPSALLAEAAERYTVETLVNGPLSPANGKDGIWLAAVRLKEQPGTAKVGEPGKPQLPEALEKLQVPPPQPAPDKR
jgi:hypothetical protein